MSVDTLSLGDLRIEGVSRAGEETWFRVHPPGLAFDVGRGAAKLAGVGDIFVSHGHLDHVLGLPYVLSLRTLSESARTRIFAPQPTVEKLLQWIDATATLAGERYDFEIHGLEPGATVRLTKELAIEAFATDHLLPGLGFHLLRESKKLKSEYRGRPGTELASLKADGVDIEDRATDIWLSYCGDTGPGVFELEPRLFESVVLLVECTFLDEASVDRARRFGHMHLRDLTDRVSEFRNRDLVLHHASRRYGAEQWQQRVAEGLKEAAPRVHLFGV